MRNLEWINDINPEILPEPYRRLAALIGIANVLRLAEEFQGMSVYFPKLDGTLKIVRDARILDEYDGCNIKELARKYGLTESWIRQLIAENPTESNQMRLFEEIL